MDVQVLSWIFHGNVDWQSPNKIQFWITAEKLVEKNMLELKMTAITHLRDPAEGVEGIAAALNLRLQFSRNENVPSI